MDWDFVVGCLRDWLAVWGTMYEPPAFASLRVPLLLTQKGEGPLPRPPRAYPAHIAALVRAPFVLRKGRWRDGGLGYSMRISYVGSALTR